jgi:hypothetical protein
VTVYSFQHTNIYNNYVRRVSTGILENYFMLFCRVRLDDVGLGSGDCSHDGGGRCWTKVFGIYALHTSGGMRVGVGRDGNQVRRVSISTSSCIVANEMIGNKTLSELVRRRRRIQRLYFMTSESERSCTVSGLEPHTHSYTHHSGLFRLPSTA